MRLSGTSTIMRHLDHHELTGAIGVGHDLSWRQTAYASLSGQVLAFDCRQSTTGQALDFSSSLCQQHGAVKHDRFAQFGRLYFDDAFERGKQVGFKSFPHRL